VADKGFIEASLDVDLALRQVADKSITIKDFFRLADIAGAEQHDPSHKKTYKPRAVESFFKKFSDSLDSSGNRIDIDKTKWFDYLTLDNARELMLSKPTDANHFVTIGFLENRVAAKYQPINEVPYPFTVQAGKQMGGASLKSKNIGLAHSVPASMLGDPETSSAYTDKTIKGVTTRVRISDQIRSKHALAGELPTVSELGQVLRKYVRNIADIDTREAVLFNLLIPFRPGEVASLSFNDVDFDTGIVREDKRSNKLRQEVKLPTVALELLKKRRAERLSIVEASVSELRINDPQAADEAVQKALGDNRVFDRNNVGDAKFVEKMGATTSHKGENSLVSLMKPYQKAMKGQVLRGAKYIRKLSATILASTLEEKNLSTGVVSKLLGHIDNDAQVGEIVNTMKSMSTGSYVGARLKSESGKKSTTQVALDILEATLGSSAGATNVNGIGPAFDIDLPDLDIKKGSMVIDFPDLSEPETNAEVTPKRPPTQLELELANEQTKLNIAETRNTIQTTNKATLEVEQSNLQTQENVAKKRIEVADLNKQSIAETTQLNIDADKIEQDVTDANKPPPAKTIAERNNFSLEKPNEFETPSQRYKRLFGGKVIQLAIGAATTAIGVGLTGGAKAADVVLDVALDPTNMGGTAEDASTADLERGVATGEALPKSGSYRANEQELQSMQQELQGRKDSKMQGQQVMDTTPAGGFALQNAQNVKSTFEDEYSGYKGFIRN